MIQHDHPLSVPGHGTRERDAGATMCTWEVLPSESRSPVIASGICIDAVKARLDVEAALACPGAGFAHLVRTPVPGLRPGPAERHAWPPLGEVQLCRRDRHGGFAWHAAAVRLSGDSHHCRYLPGLSKEPSASTLPSGRPAGPGPRPAPRPGAVLRRALAAAAVTGLVTAVAGCLPPVSSRPSATPRPSASRRPHAAPPLAPVPVPARPLTGVYEPGVPGSWRAIGSFAAASGLKPRIAGYYSTWKDPFASSFARAAWRHGAYVLVQLQPDGVPLASITAGDWDNYLRTYADAVKAFGHPVILSFGHEMNGSWYSWGDGRTPAAEFVAAWRHVVRVFRAQGAANATWLWAVNSVNGASGDLRRWWPGRAWVTWTGVDAYYYGPDDTFASVFGPTIADIRAISRAPLLIAETAVGTTADRETQIAGLFAGARADRLAGVVWFDEAQHSGIYHQDWRLEDDPSALRAFSAAAVSLPLPARDPALSFPGQLAPGVAQTRPWRRARRVRSARRRHPVLSRMRSRWERTV